MVDGETRTSIPGPWWRRMTMRPLAIILLAALMLPASAPDKDEPASFTGDWKTTFGPVRFDQKGAEVTGRIVAFNLPVKGKLDGKTLSAGYDEGQIHVDAKLALEPSGHAFKGTFQASNGN